MQDIMPFLMQHRALTLPLLIVLVLLVVLEFIKQKSNTTQLTPAQLTQLINHDDAAIIDVRTTTQFAEGHIIDAISLPFAELEEKLKKLDKLKNKPVVFVCMTGIDALKAATLSAKQGFLNPRILNGGIRAWREANMPLVKG